VPLPVTSFCTYRTSGSPPPWRNADFCGNFFAKVIKGETIGGYGDITVRGQTCRVQNDNRAQVLAWFGQMAADFLKSDDINREATFSLVPLPSHDAVVGAKFTRFPARDMAKALAAELKRLKVPNVSVADVLRFKRPLASARSGGGTRDPRVLFDEMTVVSRYRGHAIIIDDVWTSGGHLAAAAAHLRMTGTKRVWRALCAAKADQTPLENAMARRDEEVPDFDPNEHVLEAEADEELEDILS
jgi:hypothetical protein